MEIGYIYDAEGNLYPITGHTFKLHEHGEGGNPPTDYAFSFTAGKAHFQNALNFYHQVHH